MTNAALGICQEKKSFLIFLGLLVSWVFKFYLALYTFLITSSKDKVEFSF